MRNYDVLFQQKDPDQSEHLSKVVYKFACAGCNTAYINQICRHLANRIDEHFAKDKRPHIYQHLMSSKDCSDQYSKDCASVLDTANSKHQLRIKEYIYITWLKPILNKQKQCQCIASLSFKEHFLLFFFFVPDSFHFTVCVIYLIVTFNCFYI